MMILRKLLSMSCLLTVGACESGSDALDSSENLIASPHNVVQALTLDVPWSCWQVSSKEGPQKLPITALEGLRQLKAAECENRELNANYPQQTRITVAVYIPSLEVDNIVYMRAVPLYFSNRTINQAASKLLLLGAFRRLPIPQRPLSKAPRAGTRLAATSGPSERLRRSSFFCL